MKRKILFMSLCMIMQTTFAQYQMKLIPRESPDKMIYQKIGYTELTIKYGSPSVKSREIWGNLVPYGKVWRAGANSATTIKISTPILINDTKLDSGMYAFFLIPKERGKWVAIFNKVSDQWGAFKYSQKEDALRVEVTAKENDLRTENLTYHIKQNDYSSAQIVFSWDFKRIEIPFKTSYLKAFRNKVESLVDQQPNYLKWVTYLQAADHLIEINQSLTLAHEWVNYSEQIMNTAMDWNDQFYPRLYVVGHLYWVKAEILAANKDFSEATKYVDKLKSLENNQYFIKEKENIDQKYKSWKEALRP